MNELKWIREGGSQAGVAAPVVARRKSREKIAWLLAGLFFLTSLMTGYLNIRRPHLSSESIRFSVLPPEGANFSSLDVANALAISPNGRFLAFVASSNGVSSLWVRDMDSTKPRQLPGTQSATFPFWSPDSKYIGFFADGKMKKVAFDGQQPQVLCDAPTGRGGSWNQNGLIIFTPDINSGLFRVADQGGTPVPALPNEVTSNGCSNRWPFFLPDGKHFIYLSDCTTQANDTIYASSLDSKERKMLLKVSSAVAYASGYLFMFEQWT